jgi:hypothetical protein
MEDSTAGQEVPDLDDLRAAIDDFIAERDWDQFHSPKNLAMALSVEVSEIVEQFLRASVNRAHGRRDGRPSQR